jgi:predicted MFS family arabinose efflux permease
MLPLGLGSSAGTLLFGAGGRRRRRKLFLLLGMALLAVVGITGCAAPSNYKIYTITVTGTAASGGATITQSSTVDLVLARQ